MDCTRASFPLIYTSKRHEAVQLHLFLHNTLLTCGYLFENQHHA